ncbi:MAG TPA: cysteine desulfurase family protein [Bacteroidota bacterium]|nr:cysteine desulfurase family protein [Bacteroidota bacterium]
MRRIYLDHTATTPLDPRVMEAMRPCFSGTFGNASSIHSYGREAREVLERARAIVARSIGAEPGEVIFTSGGTESDNLAITGVASALGDRNGIVTASTEHHAVLEPCRYLEQKGHRVTFLPVDSGGRVDLDALRGAVGERTALVSVMHANNETGTIADIAAMAEIARNAGALFHTDAVQSAGKIPVDVRRLGVDLMTLSAHKMYGPKGIGALFLRRGVPLDPLVRGGGQERGRRPGTENVPLAVGFAEAFSLALSSMEEESARLRVLRDALEERLRVLFPGIIVNGGTALRLPHVLNISFGRPAYPLEGDMLVMNMDLEGVAVTSGSACTSGSLEPSHVIRAMGRDEETAKATLRFSFGRGNTMEDVEEVAERVDTVVQRMLRAYRG